MEQATDRRDRGTEAPGGHAPAAAGYAALAPYYDTYVAHPGYAGWVRGLAALAVAHGATGGRVLDVACGTGRSLVPLVEDGWSAVGCEVVPEMLEVAASTLGPEVELVAADMTALPVLGVFDAALLVNDAVNCALSATQLRATFAGIAANLRPGGVLVFDANTPATYRSTFAQAHERVADGLRFTWRGRTTAFTPGGRAVALLDVEDEETGEPLARTVHVQRHHPHAIVAAALHAAGFELVARIGQDALGRRAEAIDEDAQPKVLHVARLASTNPKEGGATHAEDQEDRGEAAPRAVGDEVRLMPRRPRLKPAADVRRVPSGSLYVLRGDAGGADLELEGDADAILALLRALDGSRAVPEVARALGRQVPEVAEAVEELLAAGLIEEAADDALLPQERRERFARQLGYFADLLGWPRSAAATQAALAGSTVCLLGAGGLGSWAAYALACCGVGRLVVVDGDRVELGNLNRQVLYRPDDVGTWKAEAAAGALRAFDPALEVDVVVQRLESAEDVACAVVGSDLVLDGADWPAHRIGRWVDEGCRLAGVPHLAMSQHPPQLRVGPLYVPGATGCFACQEAAWREQFPLYDELAGAAAELPSAGAFGPACGVVGALAANEAITFLAGLWEPATFGTAVLLDLRTFEVRREAVPRRESCCC